MKISSLLFTTLILTGCSQFATHRDYLSEMEHDDSSFFSPRIDFPVTSGDTGIAWNTEEERRARTPAGKNEIYLRETNKYLDEELKELEGRLAEDDKEHYAYYRPQLDSTSEKIYYLKLSREEKLEYLDSKGLLKGADNSFSDRQRMFAISNFDILLGMSKDDVLDSWGRPLRVEVAGNPSYENERWLYRRDGASKYIYFESGKVGGWE